MIYQQVQVTVNLLQISYYLEQSKRSWHIHGEHVGNQSFKLCLKSTACLDVTDKTYLQWESDLTGRNTQARKITKSQHFIQPLN